MEKSQELLTDAAAACSWREFLEVLRYWVLAADPDGEEPKDQARKRHCTAKKLDDGMVKGAFLLDPLAGSGLLNALDQEVERLKREAVERGDEPGPDHPTPSQLRLDALVRLAMRGAQRADGSTPGPLVHIVMSEKVAEDTLARIAAGDHAELEARSMLIGLGLDPDRIPVAHGDVDGRCELIDGTPVHPRLAAAALPTGVLRRLVFLSGSERVDLGRSVRSFPRHLKDALLALSRGRCDVSGCDAPLSWLEADHILPWSREKPTAISNGGVKCRPHNMAKGDGLPP
jgi:hypothetical protein